MGTFKISPDFMVAGKSVIHNPGDAYFRDYLKPYYVVTKDGQYLFASTQPGRRPDRAFYMVPEGYRLGRRQQSFPPKVGKQIYKFIENYLATTPLIVQDGLQGEDEYETGLRVVLSLANPHTAYIAWMGKLMVFPQRRDMNIECWNYIVPERLPDEYIKEIQGVWPDYEPDIPFTLYDFTEMGRGVRRVLSLSVDYFGGAYKKPNLTMVWNKAESDGLITYHAGCTKDRVLKGLSGTGKTTLTVGPCLEQDDAVLGKPIYNGNGTIQEVQFIGLEAASFAKSEGLTHESPEWVGLMKSKEKDENGRSPIVLAMNIDCEDVDYVDRDIQGHMVRLPQEANGYDAGSFTCCEYKKSRTRNGRFIFQFSELNRNWGSGDWKYLRTESLSFKRYDILEPIFRVVDPIMAVALDSACESIITSAVSGQTAGTRVRSYAATDFMVREQSHQALLKLKVYGDMGLGFDGKLVFFINNAGYVGENDLQGVQRRKRDEMEKFIPKRNENGNVVLGRSGEVACEGLGEKIRVKDSKRLMSLVEKRDIENWLEHPIWGYLLPDPYELETRHGMEDFGRRFNPMNYYTAEEYLAFVERDIRERTRFLVELFDGQEGADKLDDVIRVWERCPHVSAGEIQDFYKRHYEYEKC